MRGADYDGFAAAYTAQNDSSLFNAHYNRPELLRLTGDVRGLRVLDAGCGAGRIMSDLRDRGARVSGFDLSPAMIEIARERLGAESDLRVADLGGGRRGWRPARWRPRRATAILRQRF